jgi:8-oxo-dGTP diphosphatase
MPRDEHGPGVGVGVIVMRGDRVLLGMRAGSHGADSWAFPGGKMAFGETIAGCAARELLEETGLTGGVTRIAGVTNDIFREEGLHFVTVYVAVAGVRGEPERCEPDKCRRWEWFAHDRLPAPLFGPTRRLVEGGTLAMLASEAVPAG